ncbi:bacteriophage antitermination protein Q [Shewanella frigidimarina]|jgi:hypothetical protein|uniref:bacteriophage antitermination protein Q n=1 Tax=Shewanella frigidimarina TaxID=56812 RepID=UPI003D79F426
MRYNAEGLREELRMALLVVPRTRGQLEGFEDNAAGQQKYLSKPQREIVVGVDSDGNETIQRFAAQSITTLACRTFKKPIVPLPHNAYEHTRIVKLMNQAPHSSGQWMNYCYSDAEAMPPELVVFEVLHEFHKKQTGRINRASSELIRYLALLSCQQVRRRVNGKVELLTHAEIADMSNKSIKAWEKTWAKRWNDLLLIVERIDNRGLDYVYERSRREKTPKQHPNMLMQHRVQIRLRTEMVA